MSNSRAGSALIIVATLSMLLMLVIASVSMNSVSDVSITKSEKNRTGLEFACESGLKRASSKINDSFNNSKLNLLEPLISFQGTVVDDTGVSADKKVYSDETFVAGSGGEPDSYLFTIKNGMGNKDVTVRYSISEKEGWHKSQNYTSCDLYVDAIAYVPGLGSVAMTEEVSSRRTTLFMYSVFYQNDLEILPGPNFNLKGLIHTNENLYLNANNTLNISTDSLTAAGTITRGRLDSTDVNGTVKITKGNESGTLTTMATGSTTTRDDSNNPNWTSIATSKWAGTIKDKNLGAARLEPPKIQTLAPDGYYNQKADLKIQVVTKGYTYPQYIITLNGVTKTYDSSKSTNGLNGAITETKFYDRREFTSKQIKTTQIDVQKLAGLGFKPTNGLIYMTRDDAVADKDNDDTITDPNRVVSGFKLYNGAKVASSTTFVSNLPTYIKGDFNLHTSSDPTVDTWKPCAVMSDAITILSNSWVDSQSSSIHPASATTVNTVFVTGNTQSKVGSYNGGLENFPRFLEDWTGDNCNISGGFIQLFRSMYATGRWSGSAGYYNAPNRNWAYESMFTDLRNLPPEFINFFPSTSIKVVYYNWKQVDKNDSVLKAN